jgi:hypothetical protein
MFERLRGRDTVLFAHECSLQIDRLWPYLLGYVAVTEHSVIWVSGWGGQRMIINPEDIESAVKGRFFPPWWTDRVRLSVRGHEIE